MNKVLITLLILTISASAEASKLKSFYDFSLGMKLDEFKSRKDVRFFDSKPEMVATIQKDKSILTSARYLCNKSPSEQIIDQEYDCADNSNLNGTDKKRKPSIYSVRLKFYKGDLFAIWFRFLPKAQDILLGITAKFGDGYKTTPDNPSFIVSMGRDSNTDSYCSNACEVLSWEDGKSYSAELLKKKNGNAAVLAIIDESKWETFRTNLKSELEKKKANASKGYGF